MNILITIHKINKIKIKEMVQAVQLKILILKLINKMIKKLLIIQAVNKLICMNIQDQKSLELQL